MARELAGRHYSGPPRCRTTPWSAGTKPEVNKPPVASWTRSKLRRTRVGIEQRRDSPCFGRAGFNIERHLAHSLRLVPCTDARAGVGVAPALTSSCSFESLNSDPECVLNLPIGPRTESRKRSPPEGRSAARTNKHRGADTTKTGRGPTGTDWRKEFQCSRYPADSSRRGIHVGRRREMLGSQW